ncbi:cAMP-binding domain of CRP or a regulatory subunit of cAMP-dependent protein kinases [Arsukibacterium tuosuense]|uniref:cAMP-binding domain of CRP or a regulatory subunit of cAMP-dependent protein kinases n=1 Tax=Arsukibacterium tuosuense TaxID=1323745 RepID=A0A285INS4_9GAMM|nr:Crp/Fnr family transcriptional regulator [Arsukibacterium tuosuense]SNY49377.1 cAMP-binding domain of CRP or a regulatory subunit of cAMP-dependent protein kinases [Arsukibacterium tuosuense]
MSVAKVPLITNHLLNLLSNTERQQLLLHCDVVELHFADILCEPHQPYRYLYFPLSGFISLLTKLDGHKPLELGLIGNEGMLGVTLALGVNDTPMQAVVQGKGTAWRIEIADLQQCLLQCPHLQHILQQYLYVHLTQLAQSAACAHFHELSPRLARWLLMSHDRAHSSSFYLTHKFLADMLGVRRSGITVAAGIMQEQQLISYSRGMITILNRKALQSMSCECYKAGKDDYRSLLGGPALESSEVQAQRQATAQGTP